MWLALSLITETTHAEAMADALLERGAISVGIDDADAGTERECPQFGEPGADHRPLWEQSRIEALFESGADVASIVGEAAANVGISEVPAWDCREVAEQNWVQLTQSQFQPIRIDERLWIVPSWHAVPDPAAISIVLDPGMAFGTGSHPTTRLCLQWLVRNIEAGSTVLDYGTGSGILAIAAAKLGAGTVVGVDIDDAALTAARENATRNSVEIRLRHTRAPLEMQFDRVVANILTNPLRLLAPLLGARVTAGGGIALSGILAGQAAEVRAAYAPYVALTVAAELEGWVLLEGWSR